MQKYSQLSKERRQMHYAKWWNDNVLWAGPCRLQNVVVLQLASQRVRQQEAKGNSPGQVQRCCAS